MRGVSEQFRAFQKDHDDASVRSIIIHVGINDLPRDNQMNVAKQIYRLMIHTGKEFSNTSIFGRSFNSMINYVNNEG